jgi:hypothetical protein
MNTTPAPTPTTAGGSGGGTPTPLRSAAEVAAAGHATRRPPVWWLSARVRRERADAIAAYQAEIALRARHARIVAVRTGLHLGPVPFGYTLAPRHDVAARVAVRGRWLVPDPDRAWIVELIYRWRVGAHLGVAEIVRLLAADPCPYPAPLCARWGAAEGWTAARVRAILTEPRYTGRAVLRAARREPTTGWTAPVLTPDRTHPALIDDDTWRAAHRLVGRPLPALPDSPNLPPPLLPGEQSRRP